MSPTTDSDLIRETFLRFFERHNHTRIKGASIVPVNDPTLLFINSGMAPLKRYFTGESEPPAVDLCNVQGCIRTKDIDDVGDRHHITFFEMLGSWSIGGYFKERAVELAWELLTDDLKLPPEHLYVSVFAGDDALGLPPDEESAAAWERVGVPRDHIVALPAEDNFWGPAGESGPCGPCTEVFLDTGDAFGAPYTPGGEFDTTRRYIEIWNAGVFMQFDKGLDGVLRPLPLKSVDTGSGIERLQLALDGLDSLYDTDLLAPVVQAVQETLGETGEVLHHHRVISDHLRAAVAILAEGIAPSNEGRGYIPRRLIRKSVTMVLGQGHERFDPEPVVHAVIDRMARYYLEWAARRTEIVAAVRRECADFEGTVRRGLEQLDRTLARHGEIRGEDAFQLLATHGLPIDITEVIADARGVSLDLAGFQAELARHRSLSRSTSNASDGVRRTRPDDVLPSSLSDAPRTEFLGYETLEAEAQVIAILVGGVAVDRAGEGDEADLITDRSPFYAEGGGQVGDRGTLTGRDGSCHVVDTVAHGTGRFLHRATVTSGEVRVGESLRLMVDAAARAATAANHTATHLLNAALREVLGDHVRQAGSLVDPARLRFDFRHPRPVTKTELARVERLVNSWVLADAPRDVEVMAPEEAKAAGALSLAGEEYGDSVRVLSFGPFSKELCGGTHVSRTSQIGSFRVVSEQSSASGVRRIVAVTREHAMDLTLDQSALLTEAAATLRTAPQDILPAIERLARSAKANAGTQAVSVARQWEARPADVPVVVAEATGATAGLRKEAQRLAGEGERVALLWGVDGARTHLVVSVADRHQSRIAANTLLGRVADHFGGAGGGNARVAQGVLRAMPDPEALLKVIGEAVGPTAAE
ncbi:alanine--tRNA ligase [Streptomyces sp. NPDC057555]|uniref:Alanine--tRNA ligase n=1 Tax=Streptomyces sp. JCM 9888 TaxID=1570103 RepID=A0A0B5GUF4_9ACTN|nr:Alanyl-tRNA synthetase [Streptomyces sp. JCM 9888]